LKKYFIPVLLTLSWDRWRLAGIFPDWIYTISIS